MEMTKISMFKFVFVILGLLVCSIAREFNWTIANTSIWLSSAAYCDASTYLSRSYIGYSSGFTPTQVIDTKEFDVQLNRPSTSSIEALLLSLTDWIDNLNVPSYPLCNDCEVHSGFYYAEQSVIAAVIQEVSRLLATYPDYEVIVTGHSLGAALATLTIADITYQYLTNNSLSLYNFGSPRVGDRNFAVFASNLIVNKNRITHYRDIVPHLPWYERFEHISGEWYEDQHGVIHDCEGYEDPHCAYQWYLLSIQDHLHYLGLEISCEAVSG